ncbi:decarboxylating NADP(+)-dependent phosphogluconate dehydrogenase [Treponema parvum]|uniref:decarboxylating NADP(+)-dependent phosphogluconate dehydrogenase n=1 Tax=Treponema parvum TaxID=138851 RepID=UPI001AEBC58F|nr:decarboxylating NADP(+)-dependent phosphogluconate dehydrogenase [Treponema parvum]QTQ17131.1 decarboxylating NADP(+)-dependent phosphogluconate dehydrogenase [Treponema parvum]
MIENKKASIGVIGLAVMGENLVLNMERNGFTVAVFNRTVSSVDNFAQGRGKNKNIIPAHSLEEFVASIERPRCVMLMIKAGSAVDGMINALVPLMDKGDVIIDGGNSNFIDTERRTKEVESKGLLYIGTGVSGGEEGALNGPSIMPGGSKAAWPIVKPVLQSISAKVNGSFPCCDWIGPGGAGHFVKMVHNGIEYGDMQLICEVYDIMRKLLKMDCKNISDVFTDWNKGVLSSYLIEITGNLLKFKDSDGEYLVNKILDTAGQKGTGKWTVINALEAGVPLTLVTESVFARCLSSDKEKREECEKIFSSNIGAGRTAIEKADSAFSAQEVAKQAADKTAGNEGFNADAVKKLHDALYAAKIISYAQGFELMQKAGAQYDWQLDLGNIAMLWRGGCIIRSVFLQKIKDAYERKADLKNLVMDPYFSDILNKAHMSLRETVSSAAMSGIPVPSLSAALSWFDGIRCNDLPANLLQAQRDYFGAHTYERKDKKRGEFFHTDWTGHGGNTSSTTYNI